MKAKKVIILLILSSCHFHQGKIKCDVTRPISHFFINTKDFLFKSKKEKIEISEQKKENFSIDLRNEEKFVTKKEEIIQPKTIKDKEDEATLHFNLVNNQRKREPFENQPEPSEVNKNALFGFGYKKQDEYSIIVNSNIANVRFDPQNQNNQLDIQFNNRVNNLNFQVKINF